MTVAAQDLRWWSAEKANRHSVVATLVKQIQEKNAYRRQLDLHHLRLYADRHISGFGGHAYARPSVSAFERRPRLSINVVRSCVDAATARITKARPRATYLTNGADYDLQQRAKKRERFISGVWHQNQAYILAQRAFKDAAIFGTGLIKVCREYGRIRLEKTFPGEILVDDEEARYGEPRSLFQVRSVDKLVLKELYPKRAKEIEDSPAPSGRQYGRGAIADQCEVFEAWHLPSGPDADDGRHGLYTETTTLFEEKYEHEAFPFAVFRWNEDSLGWWGTGIAYELTGIQYEINQLLRAAQAGMYAGANFKVLVERGAKIVKAHLNNDVRGTIIEYTGQPPAFIAPDAVSNQLLLHLQWLLEQAFAQARMSQYGVRGEIPAELAGSGRAQLVYQNNEDQGFLPVSRAYESAFMDLAERCLEAAADIYKTDPGLVVDWVGPKTVERIAFEEIAGDADAFHVQVFPTSALPNDPAGRFAYVEQLRAGQYIDQAEAKKLLDFPDVTKELDLDLAPVELIDERIDRILVKGEYHPPHPRMDLELALKRSTLAYQRAELDGTPPERLDMLGQFVDETNDLLATAAPPPAPPGMAMPLNPTDPALGGPLPGEMPMGPVPPMPPQGPVPLA